MVFDHDGNEWSVAAGETRELAAAKALPPMVADARIAIAN